MGAACRLLALGPLTTFLVDRAFGCRQTSVRIEGYHERMRS
jgi:hypothetical protein